MDDQAYWNEHDLFEGEDEDEEGEEGWDAYLDGELDEEFEMDEDDPEFNKWFDEVYMARPEN